jgi:hypothetical protein
VAAFTGLNQLINTSASVRNLTWLSHYPCLLLTNVQVFFSIFLFFSVCPTCIQPLEDMMNKVNYMQGRLQEVEKEKVGQFKNEKKVHTVC